jgi:hypothetical protein
MRNYLEVLTAAFAGPGPVDVENDGYRVHSPLDVTDVVPTPILLAALGPIMLAIAGALASGTILWMADPVAAVRGVYERWQIPFGEELAERIRAHLGTRPKDRHGAHDYSFADTGLDLEKERLRYADYQEYFRIPSEVR